jgi:hypothetical protein
MTMFDQICVRLQIKGGVFKGLMQDHVGKLFLVSFTCWHNTDAKKSAESDAVVLPSVCLLSAS